MAALVEAYAEQACQSPALLTHEESRERVAGFYWSAAWSLYDVGLKEEAAECLGKSGQLAPPGLLSWMRHHIGARWPTECLRLMRLRNYLYAGMRNLSA